MRMVMNVYVSYVVQGDTNPEPQDGNFLGTSDISQNGYFQSAALGNLILSYTTMVLADTRKNRNGE